MDTLQIGDIVRIKPREEVTKSAHLSVIISSMLEYYETYDEVLFVFDGKEFVTLRNNKYIWPIDTLEQTKVDTNDWSDIFKPCT